jgi:tetratricopeptide (TPR) repeat protein
MSDQTSHLTAQPGQFLVLLPDDDDAKGLANLLDDVRKPGQESLASFEAPRPGGAAYLRKDTEAPSADVDLGGAGQAPHRVLLLQHEPELEALIPLDRDLFMIGVSQPEDAAPYRDHGNVVTFVAAGPLDFAAEVMERFSGPDALLPLFDPDEAARMRALVADFPIDLDIEPTPARGRLEEGIAHFREGRFADALRAFDELLASEPDSAEVHLWRGYALREIVDERKTQGLPVDEQRTQAIQAFSKALDTGYYGPAEVGDALLDLDDPAGAATAYRHALGQTPDASWLHTSLGTSLTVDKDLEDRFQLGSDEFTRAIELDPNNSGAWRSRGVVRVNLCRYEEALGDLDRAQELEAGADPLTHMDRAVALSALGELSRARQAAAHASRLGTTHPRRRWIEYIYASILLQLEDLVGAQAALNNAETLAVEQTDFDVLAKVKAITGLLLARLGRVHDASAACHSAIEHDPTEPGPFATLAWISQSLGRLDEAGDAITRAVHLVETDHDWTRGCQYIGAKWPIYLMQASILNALSDRYSDVELAEEALAATQQAWDDFQAKGVDHRAADPERGAQIFLERAYALHLCHRTGEAGAALKEARALAPPRSRPWLAATRALRDAPESLKIGSPTIVVTEVTAIAGATALFLFAGLASGAFVTLVIALLALGLATFALPVLTKLRVGGWLELEKVVAITHAQAIPRLDVPLPRPQLSPPTPQVNRPYVANRFPLTFR